MLVLSRRIQESVVVGGTGASERNCIVTVLGITGAKVRLGFEVPADIPVHRLEVWKQIKTEIQRDRAEIMSQPPIHR